LTEDVLVIFIATALKTSGAGVSMKNCIFRHW